MENSFKINNPIISFINTDTGETMFETEIENCDASIDNSFSYIDKDIEYKNSKNHTASFSCQNCIINDELQKYMIDNQRYTIIANLKDITKTTMTILRYYGFEVYPKRKNKNKRIQKKWNKKYGYVVINRNIKINE